jgi:WXG100 family type VII secretion target
VEEKIMPGSLIRVTPEQLNSVAGQLNAGASSIDGTLAQLRGNVAPLGSDWAGTAQARFQSLWEQWQSSSRALHQALVDIGQLMNQAGAAYDSNEQQIASSFGR